MDWTILVLSKLIFFTFFSRFQLICPMQLLSNSSAINSTLRILNQNLFFVPIGDSIRVDCSYSLARKYSSKLNCSGLFWEWNGKRFINNSKASSECVSVLYIGKVLWFGKQNFHCIYQGSGIKGASRVENKSLTVISGYKPKPMSKPTTQWIEDEVEVTWLAANYSKTKKVMNYTVEYFCTPVENLCAKNVIPGDCGYFQLNNCSEKTFHCRASFLVLLGKIYTIRVIAKNKFGRQSSENVKMNIPRSRLKMMFKPISELTVFSTRLAVKINWKSVSHAGRKKVWYRCQGDEISRENLTRNDVYEILQDRLPVFQYCLFCVSRQRFQQHGHFSCATCKTIRTAESIPRATAKFIPCQLNGCPTVSSGNFRNVTVSWHLPAKSYWNGIIRNQKIYYYGEDERELHNITIKDGNITAWTLGNLKYSVQYSVFMFICTTAGCSDRSNTIYISAVLGEERFELFSDKANSGVLIGVPLIILGVCFGIIFVILYLKRHEGERLPNIREPQVEANTSQLSPLSDEEEYDVFEQNEGGNDDLNGHSAL